MADADDLREALALIKERISTATAVQLTTSDQNVGYGFVWVGVNVDGEWAHPDDAIVPGDLIDAVDGLINDLNWNGVVGEDKTGDAELSLDLDPLVTFEVEFTTSVTVRVPQTLVAELGDTLPKRLHSWPADVYKTVVSRAEDNLRGLALTDDSISQITRTPDGDYSTS